MQATPSAAKPRRGRPTARPQEDRSLFERWIDTSGMSRDEVAAKLNLGRSTLFALLKGDHYPSLETAVAIEELTGGAVPPRAWIKK